MQEQSRGALEAQAQTQVWKAGGGACGEEEAAQLEHSAHSKHEFLKIAKDLRTKGIRCDDDLTRLQQQEREQLSTDFNTLKSKGHKPFFRGSSSKFRHADKMHTCKRNGAKKAPDAQA